MCSKLQPITNLLGFRQELDSLVPPALIYIEQTELHQTVGHHVVVEPDLLLPEQEREKKVGLLAGTVRHSSFHHEFHTQRVWNINFGVKNRSLVESSYKSHITP